MSKHFTSLELHAKYYLATNALISAITYRLNHVTNSRLLYSLFMDFHYF